MRRIIALAAVLALAILSVHAQNIGEPLPRLTNKEVLEMLSAGISGEVIIAKIKVSQCNFDTAPSILTELNHKGVPNDVLKAMIEAPSGVPKSEKPIKRPASTEQLATREPEVVDITKIIATAEDHFRKGKLHLEDSKREKARDEFDKAVDSILESGFDVRASQKLQTYYLELVERIYREEVPLQNQAVPSNVAVTLIAQNTQDPKTPPPLAQIGFRDQKSEPSPLDELKNLELSEEEKEPKNLLTSEEKKNMGRLPIVRRSVPLPSSYSGMDPLLIYEALSRADKPKGEFETTAEYRQRLERPTQITPKLSSSDLMEFMLEASSVKMLYDADDAKMLVEVPLQTPSYYDTSGLRALTLANSVGLCLSNFKDFHPRSPELSAGISNEAIIVRVGMDRSRAMLIKSRLRVMAFVRLEGRPYTNTKFLHSRSYEISSSKNITVRLLELWLYDFVAGKVIARIQP